MAGAGAEGFGLGGEVAAFVVGVPADAVDGGHAVDRAGGDVGAECDGDAGCAADDGPDVGLGEIDDAVRDAALAAAVEQCLLTLDFCSNQELLVPRGVQLTQVPATRLDLSCDDAQVPTQEAQQAPSGHATIHQRDQLRPQTLADVHHQRRIKRLRARKRRIPHEILQIRIFPICATVSRSVRLNRSRMINAPNATRADNGR
jgi:hypothetical protein